MKSPCKDCEERTASCHCTCDDYRKYQDEMQKQRDQRRMACISRPIAPKWKKKSNRAFRKKDYNEE